MNKQKLEAAPGITCYREPFGIRFVNFYALDDPNGYILFDTAIPGVVTTWLDEKGLEGNIQQAIISHADVDHFGDTAALKARFPAMRVLCHPADCRWIEDHDLIIKEHYDYARPLYHYGFDQETLKMLRDLCGPDFKVDQTIADGDTLNIGSRQWGVLHVPGHTPGHIALWSEADGILLVGDAVLGFGPPDTEGKPSMPSTHQYIADYLNTIDRLAQLSVKLVLSGHWPFLDAAEFQQLLADSKERVRQDLEVILQACQEKPQSFAELVAILNTRFRTWPESQDTAYMVALSGSLEYLMAQGSLEERDGRYTTVA